MATKKMLGAGPMDDDDMPPPGDEGAPGAADGDMDGDDGVVSIPLSVLMINGTPPEQGDEVTFAVMGKVTGVQGDTAMVQLSEVNGQPVGGGAGQGGGPDDDSQPLDDDDEEEARLGRLAASADRSGQMI